MTWNVAQYQRFGGPRLRPAEDLLARIPREDRSEVVDLGCGTGNVTALLRARWPDARIVGVDASPAMLDRARASVPGVTWIEADIAAWRPEVAADLIFSNAALHWLEGHDTFFPRLFESLAPGGVLAVQMPRNFGASSHTLMAEAARAGPWRETLEPRLRTLPVQAPETYFDLLSPLAKQLDLWETEYLHVLSGDDPVLEWTRGTWLRPLLEALDEPHRSRFEVAYRDRLREAYPRRPDGKTLFPFRRLFLLAERD